MLEKRLLEKSRGERRRGRRPRGAAALDEAVRRGDPNFVTALARGLELLRSFSSEDQYLGNRELSERTGIPRPTVSRLTQTLTTLGYLHYSEHLAKYRLGAAVLALGYRFLASSGVRSIARPYMQALADEADCAVALGEADRLSMTYIEVCNGRGPLILRLRVGARLPMTVTSMGRAYLAALPEARRVETFAELRRADPEGWPETERQLELARRDYERLGFCFAEGSWNGDVSAVGVPLVLEGGEQVLAFNCGGASLRLTRRVLEQQLGPRLVELARQVERELMGGRAPT